jgi:AraC-like DNA-binding protein
VEKALLLALFQAPRYRFGMGRKRATAEGRSAATAEKGPESSELQATTRAPGDTTLRIVRESRALGRERLARRAELVLPLESSVLELFIGGKGKKERLDRSRLAVLPSRAVYELFAVSPVAQVAFVALGEDAYATFFREYEGDVSGDVLRDVLAEPRFFPRTRWVDEIVHRYVFERSVCDKHWSQAARFLETELVKEVYFLGKEALENHTRASVVQEDLPLVAKVRAYIDAHLFEDVSVSVLCESFGASESTLLRTFRREVGTTPADYTRGRRLDEARLLLEGGSYSASEVAVHVGYASLPAFTVAFTRKFGDAPSSVRKARGASVLPPHGEPPVRRKRERV